MGQPNEAGESLQASGSTLTDFPEGEGVVVQLPAPLAEHQRRLWQQVGVERCRVWVVDLHERTPVACRWMSDSGLIAERASDTQLDIAGPGVAERLIEWARPGFAPLGEVVMHMLSPRRWLLFWRVDAHAGVLAQLRHVQGRTTIDPPDRATIQLLCEQWLQGELMAVRAEHTGSPGWNHIDRRARGTPPKPLLAALAASLLGAAAAAWLTVGGAATAAAAAEAQRRELQRLATLADQSMARGLSHVLAAGDYGELQALLVDKVAIGQITDAVIFNVKAQAVAQVGSTPGVTLGAAITGPLPPAARTLELSRDAQPLGRLVVFNAPAGGPGAPEAAAGVGGPVNALRWVALLVTAACVAAAAALIWHLRGKRQRSGRP